MTYGTVVSTELLTPTLKRVRFAGEGLHGFTSTGFTDEYVNALFIPDGAPYSPPFDVDQARSLAPEFRPRGRRETVRRWDGARRVLTIDFVVHGDVGYAGRWATQAKPGDGLQMLGPSGAYRPDPDADWHLFAGDESALPAIASSLEAVPHGHRCHAFVVVDDADHEIELACPGDLSVHWLHRRRSTNPSGLLPEAVETFPWRDGDADVFVHGEAAEVRAVRKFLIAHRGIDRATASISPYWRRGDTDETWREVKAQWLADQEADV